jgi:hypothetical protein
VEALSVTPFADRAVDRGLAGVLVALVREMSAACNGNTRAGSFDRNDELADHVVRYLKRRAENVTGDKATGAAVEQQLDARLDQWRRFRRRPAEPVRGRIRTRWLGSRQRRAGRRGSAAGGGQGSAWHPG